MILKASERGGGAWLGRHLLNVEQNERCEVHGIRGFTSDSVMGAMKEAQAMSYGTRCKNYLFSLSMNPPPNESVDVEVFEKTVADIEERFNLQGHARIMVFHEKEARRHCHAVWSRIDPDTMTAKNLPHFKNKLTELSRQIYLDQDWKMPPGFMGEPRDPRNFSLDEWQAAKRVDLDTKDSKARIQDCWAVSDSAATFKKALEENGFYLARGDRRGHVVVSYEGAVFGIARTIGKHVSAVRARLGNEEGPLRSVTETRQHIAETVKPRISEHIREAKKRAALSMQPLNHERLDLKERHHRERKMLDEGQRLRQENEAKERALKIRTGFLGLWDKLRGQYAQVVRENETEALSALRRDQTQRAALVTAQFTERSALQDRILWQREQNAKEVLDLYRDAAKYRLMQRGEAPVVKKTPVPSERMKTNYTTIDERLQDRKDRFRTISKPQGRSHDLER